MTFVTLVIRIFVGEVTFVYLFVGVLVGEVTFVLFFEKNELLLWDHPISMYGSMGGGGV